MSAGTQVLMIVICMGFGAFFAGMETGIVSLNRLRLRHLVRRRVHAAMRIDRMLRQPEILLGTTLVGTNLCYVIISVFSTRLAVQWLGITAGPWVASAVMTLVILVACEYLPKAWFQSYPARRVLPLAGVLHLVARLLTPISWTLHQVVRLLLPGGRHAPAEDAAFITREELIHLAGEGARTGTLTREEGRMIRRVFSLGSRTCGDLMIPVERVVTIAAEADWGRIRELAARHGFSRYPVRGAAQEGFTGILHLRDVLRLPDPAGQQARTLMRPPQYVPAHMPVDHVLPRMRATGSPMMLVTDAAFRVVGIITMEEVLAEIVGATDGAA